MKSAFKRLFDIILSLISIILLSPIILITFFLIRRKLGSPAIFKQRRPGMHGKIFTMYKFRSMTDLKDEDGELLSDEDRLTNFGNLIRKTSLDELPELLNILKGDMSFVGPRPLLVSYLDRYTERQARRHEVKPGLTGWAQINGRNTISWEDKFKLDVWYVDNWTFSLDLKILFLTLGKVLNRNGINAIGEATMTEFKGSREDD